MEILITSIAALGLLGLLVALVFALHHYQLSAAQSQVDRSLPLPPIGTGAGQRHTRSIGLADGGHLESNVAPPRQPATPAAEMPAVRPPEGNWLEQVNELKRQGRRAEALAVCRKAFPLWSAYQQASLILRAEIKSELAAGRSPAAGLKELYQLAAVAGLLHDRVKGLPSLTAAQLKHLDLSRVQALPMPYGDIGYLSLRLIKKSDIKLLLELWGKPDSHLSPREFHRDFWAQLADAGGTDSAA